MGHSSTVYFDFDGSGSLNIQDSYIEITERAAPTGTANKAKLYAVDVAGKTRLSVIFGSGAAQTIATEP
jgi:hypothetical protein